MGNSGGGEDPISHEQMRGADDPMNAKKDGTTLVEWVIPNIRDAHDLISRTPRDLTPLILKPANSRPNCCGVPVCWLTVPQGFFAMITKWGADVTDPDTNESKVFEPGCHFFPCQYSVSRLVTEQHVIFDTPVKDCRTGDNIPVSIDVMIVFKIVNAYQFVHKAGGPEKLDIWLRSMQEEALRQLALETQVEDIYDLFGRKAEIKTTIDDINQSCKNNQYGIEITDMTVKQVKIGSRDDTTIADQMEEKTLFQAQENHANVLTKKKLLEKKNDEDQNKLKTVETTRQEVGAEQIETTKATLNKEINEFLQSTEKEIAELGANKDAEVSKVRSESELETSKIKAQILALERELRAEVDASVGRITFEASAYKKGKEAAVAIEVAQLNADGKKALAEAEGVASAAFLAKREHEADLERLAILESLVTNKRVSIAASSENTSRLSSDNQLVSQVAQQGLEAVRMKLADLTATSIERLETKPRPQIMR